MTRAELLEQIADKAILVRQYQRTYFRTRSSDDLNASKTAEKELDVLLAVREQKNYAEQGSIL